MHPFRLCILLGPGTALLQEVAGQSDMANRKTPTRIRLISVERGAWSRSLNVLELCVLWKRTSEALISGPV